jgi:hypothetical protein
MPKISASLRNEIELEAQNLEIDHSWSGLLCPFCLGGSSGERTFSITRTDSGLLYNCYRGSCNSGRGFLPTAGYLVPAAAPKDKAPKPYYGTFEELEDVDRAYFARRFDVQPEYQLGLGVNSDGYYVQAVFAPNGMHRGYAVRYGCWGGSPECPRSVRSNGPKTRIYMNNPDAPTQSWYYRPSWFKPDGTRYDGNINRIVLVEDCISAMKVAQDGLTGVALLGVGLDNNKVREIGMQHPSEVMIALDADATDEAFKLARRWGLAFPKTRVVILDKDLKDMTRDEVRGILS